MFVAADGLGFVANPYPAMVRFLPDNTLDPSVSTKDPNPGYEQIVRTSAGTWLGISWDLAEQSVSLERRDANLARDATFDATEALKGMQKATVAVAPDGSIFVAGADTSSVPAQIMLRKLMPGGGIDTTFGVGGTVISTFSIEATGKEVALQKDGKILVGALSGVNPAVARFAADGTVDESYGDNGIASFSGTSLYSIRQLMLDEQGRALVLTEGFRVARLLDTGALDPSFGFDGVAGMSVTQSSGEDALAWSLTLQSDGKIVVGGAVEVDPDFNGVPNTGTVVLARFDANGTADATFGTGGAARVQLDEDGEISIMSGHHQSVAALSDGRLAVSGIEQPNSGSRAVISVVWQ
jgi:uncharacterized delta-60 repeat protein